jgi:hypothetical protein
MGKRKGDNTCIMFQSLCRPYCNICLPSGGLEIAAMLAYRQIRLISSFASLADRFGL